MFLDHILLVIKDIKRRKFSSFLTLFAISLGIFAIYVIIVVSQGFQISIEKQIEEFGTNQLLIFPVTTNGLNDEDLRFVQSKPYIERTDPIYFDQYVIQYANQNKEALVFGVKDTEEFFDAYNLDLKQGRFPKNNEKYSAIIGPLAASDLFNREIRIGTSFTIKETKFKLVGILESVGNPQDDSQMYVNIDTLREIDGVEDEIGIIYATVPENYDILNAKENLKIALENKKGEDTFFIQTFDQLIKQFNDILNIVQLTLTGIALVSLIVGAFGIINTMYVIVTEKFKDIGIMKAIGATNWDILFIFMFQAGLFGLLGAIVGIILGIFASLGFEKFANNAGWTVLDITIDPIIISSLLIFGFIIGIISGFLPAKKASKLQVIESLKK